MDEQALNWRDLRVTNEQTDIGSLGELVDRRASCIRRIESFDADNSILGWEQYFVSAPDEDPDWNTPVGPTDWSGLREAVEAIQASDETDDED